VSSEVFHVVWNRRHQLPAPDEVRPWLFGILRNVVRNEERSDRRTVRLRAKLATVAPVDEPDAGIDPALEAALRALAPIDRELLVATAIEGFRPAEIAADLGLTPEAARTRLSRARADVRRALSAELPVSGGRP
jgi:RNA polymerase sigma-70 factor (ECF subfamily)